MRKRTYKNFLYTMEILQHQKHYTVSESEKIARQIWRDVEADRGKGNRTAEWFLSQIISKEEWVNEYR